MDRLGYALFVLSTVWPGSIEPGSTVAQIVRYDPVATPFRYDVFLSHASNDKDLVRALAEKLKADGLQVWFDEWIIKPGDLIPKTIDEGLEASRVLVLCISRHYFSSEWSTFESGTFRFRDSTNKERRYIPLRLDGSEIPDTLRQFAYVDWGQQQDLAYRRLLESIRPLQRERESTSELLSSTQPIARTLSLGHTAPIRSVALSPDGLRALSGSEDRTVRVWDVASGRCAATLLGHTASVNSVAFSSDGTRSG